MENSNQSDGSNGQTATIEDVAVAAGVSVATVSRALRDLPNVAPSTRERVLKVAAEMSYVANPTAARLAAGRTGTIAVVVPVFDSWYFAKVVAGIEAVLKESSHDLLLYAVSSEAERTRFIAGRGAWWRRSDALVMVDVRLADDEAARLAALGARLVTIGSKTKHFPSVTLDERGATEQAVEHLVRNGHRRIGVLTGDRHALGFRVPMLRLEAFRARIRKAGIELDPELEQAGGFSIEGGREAMGQLLALQDPPTAVFAMSDEMAIGALDLLRARGLRSPDDAAIVGFDDNDMAPLFGLTTVRQDVDHVGVTAGRLVIGMLGPESSGDRPEPVHVVSPTSLVVRSSA